MMIRASSKADTGCPVAGKVTATIAATYADYDIDSDF